MKNSTSMDRSYTTITVTTEASTEVSKIGITAVGVTAGVIGCWAVASMIAGAINSGGPIELVSSLFQAISG